MTDGSHEMSCLIFSEKKMIYFRMLYAAAVMYALTLALSGQILQTPIW